MNKIISMILLCAMLLSCLVGCEYFAPKHEHDFSPSYDEMGHVQKCACGEITGSAEHSLEWVVDKAATNTINGTKHLECSCGYRTEEKTPIPIEKNEDGTLKLDETLIGALSEYLREPSGDIMLYSLGDKLGLCNSGYTPLFVETGDEVYFVAVYSNETPENPENPGDYVHYEEYTWVGLENATEIQESWNGEAFVAAFIVNPAKLCKNLKSGETDYKMEHFCFFRPKFKDGFALERENSFKYLAIQLTESSEKQLYCSISSAFNNLYSIGCIELDGEYYVKQQISTRLADGTLYEHNLELAFGEYYDDLMGVMITGKYSVTTEPGDTHEYGLISVSDLANCFDN